MAMYNGKPHPPFVFINPDDFDFVELQIEMLTDYIRNSPKADDENLSEVLASLELARIYYARFQES
jgi:hypothetical protein